MVEVTISKNTYNELLEKALRYDYLKNIIREDIFSSPPTKDAREVVRAFENTGLYRQKFISGLKKGLACSSYFEKK